MNWKPIDMQDVRLVAGEGKLTNADVLRAVNVIVRQRLEAMRRDEYRKVVVSSRTAMVYPIGEE